MRSENFNVQQFPETQIFRNFIGHSKVQIQMMTRRFTGPLLSVAIAILSLVLPSCIKQESYSVIPEIGYQSFQLVYPNATAPYPSTGILSITFQDGDGDIGLTARDTLPPYNKEGNYYYNFVIRYFEKRDTGYAEVVLDPPYSLRLPILNMGYTNKAIKGLIVDTLAMDPSPAFDTIRFEVFLYDRALHKSNVVTTPDIVLRRSGF
jgi:hypothetical protein